MYLLQLQSLRQKMSAGTAISRQTATHHSGRATSDLQLLMRRLLVVLALILTLTLPAAADKAKSFYNKGRDAEARQNYEQAYDFYKQAYDLKPQDLRYRSA